MELGGAGRWLVASGCFCGMVPDCVGDSSSTEGKFCNLYCLRCVIRAVQEGSFAICTARGV